LAATAAAQPAHGRGVLDELISRSFTEAQAVAAYRSFTSFLLGHLLLESAAHGASTAPVEDPLNEGDAALSTADTELDVTDYPTVGRLRTPASRGQHRGRVRAGPRSTLDRMDLALSQ